MLTVGISLQLQWGPLMRDHTKVPSSRIYDSFHFFSGSRKKWDIILKKTTHFDELVFFT